MTSPPAAFSRRSLLRGAVGAGALAALSGCSVASGLTTAGEPASTLQFWDLFGGGDGVRMQSMLDVYRKQNPDITLKSTTFNWGNPYYTKVSLATVGNKPPDVAVAHLTRAKSMVEGGLLQELTPDTLERAGMTPDKFNDRAWNAGLVDGKAYAIPFDTHPFVMFYNTDICEKAGLLDADGVLKPLNGEQAFLDAMQKAKQVTGGFAGAIAMNTEIVTPWRAFQSLYSQLGGTVLADDGTKVVIDDAKALRTLTFLRGLTKSGLFPENVDYQGSIADFSAGRTAFLFQGEWEITTFQTAKTPFSMALFPHVFDEGPYAVQADSHTLVIPQNTKLTPERLDRALAFIRSLLDQSNTWAEGGHIPSWLPYRNSAEYRALQPQATYASAADSAAYDPEGWYSGSGSNFEIVTGSAIGAMMAGISEPQQALDEMRTKLDNLAATASPI
ncbi:extracellular solute-binding protein [Cryptosporangium aurantiacum]|uniref:Carbohydrate ABC transporter substrate-binding protein, CUT1 family n=1 Tax=Cryptosporangium aurantiacum TaxID=134849 RepID=A0A1M7RNV2_9ACTN|nr:extracellular solute-binding protein [Cryptosporangium aurantiacum]SHN47881.1 carbohydrate ABC transporter substrate-binding protein, CUT1 family [Cryptosporangium aurantiacum]